MTKNGLPREPRLWDWWPPAYLTYGLVATVIVFALHSLLLWAMMELTDAVPNATRQRNIGYTIAVWAVIFGSIYIWVIIPLWKRVYWLVGGRGNIFLDPMANLDEAYRRKLEMERVKNGIKLRHYYSRLRRKDTGTRSDTERLASDRLPADLITKLSPFKNTVRGAGVFLILSVFLIFWAAQGFRMDPYLAPYELSDRQIFCFYYNYIVGYGFFWFNLKIFWAFLYRALGGGQDIRYIEFTATSGAMGSPPWTMLSQPFFYDKAERAKQRKGRTKNKWIPD